MQYRKGPDREPSRNGMVLRCGEGCFEGIRERGGHYPQVPKPVKTNRRNGNESEKRGFYRSCAVWPGWSQRDNRCLMPRFILRSVTCEKFKWEQQMPSEPGDHGETEWELNQIADAWAAVLLDLANPRTIDSVTSTTSTATNMLRDDGRQWKDHHDPLVQSSKPMQEPGSSSPHVNHIPADYDPDQLDSQ